MNEKQHEKRMQAIVDREDMKEQHLLIDDVRDFGPMRTCRNYHDGIQALQEQTWDVLWLDYDLGIGCWSGMDVLAWLELNPQYLPKQIKFVSFSPDARREMKARAEALYIKVKNAG